MTEFEIIKSIAAALERRGDSVVRWIGDDAAVVKAGNYQVTSIDSFVDGVHLQIDRWPTGSIGHKLLAASASDIAAMGVAPSECLLSLGLPMSLNSDMVLELYEGVEEVASDYGVTVTGGDLTSSPTFFATVVVTGWCQNEADVVGRDNSKVGDLVGVSGVLGGAAAGVELINGTEASLDGETREALIDRQFAPTARVEEGQLLAKLGVTSMIDVSDGIAGDARRLAEASGNSIVIDLSKLPIQSGVAEVAAAVGKDTVELAAAGGEDYELLFTAPKESSENIESDLAAIGCGISWVGTVAELPEATVVFEGSGVSPNRLQGFDHFRLNELREGRPQ